MRNRFFVSALLFLWLQPARGQYKIATPGYRYEYPRDHFNHPDFQTEWWYFTGNLTAPDGRRFGFELTFFRRAVSRDPARTAAWDIRDLYLGHLALSDLDGGEFFYSERVNRAGPGIAGVSESQERIWNGNWEVVWKGEEIQLHAADERLSLSLSLYPEKPPVIHGENGISQKAEGAGHASHYMSFTRLKTRGTMSRKGETYQFSGTSWMDHEFFTHQLTADQAGWDWFSLQLNDDTEIMLFRIRRKDGAMDPFSAGTFVDAHGKSLFLRAADFSLTPLGDSWKSPVTLATYPTRWKIVIPKLDISVEAQISLKSQELASPSKSSPSYWEGAISFAGSKGRADLRGVGYLEMTGYDKPVDLGR
jgi:predicted secreted hydrolase